MPKIDKDAHVEVKLDGAAGLLEQSLTDEQRRGLFEYPGMSVIAIVEFTSVTYTGHASSEDKSPQVKVRMSLAEAAQDHDQAAKVLEVARAMMRRRKMQNTLDELGPGTHDAERAVAEALAHHPTEVEYEHHQAQQEARRGRERRSRIEQHG
ncbi:hypothetical protein [Streptomyces mirabilis]|uniref:hypothetical protein n=1 Tax=Streptomyces mirabilis TaxID=68239 RepID=UPI002255A8BB|nr:hypothetical protein [Streptomyces mirabilis]MCX4615738.1 hypothetical protein [Streptomyces mirabilis]